MPKQKSKYDTPIAKLNVRGIVYEICLYPKSVFNSRYPNTLAQVEEEPFVMRFCEAHIRPRVIKHELFHCYMASCFLSTQSDLSPQDAEEVACDVFAYLSDQILEAAQELQQVLETELNLRSKKEQPNG